MTAHVLASAPGKVNLALLVGDTDEFGYHPLSTVFEGISLREYVSLEGGGGEVRTLVYQQRPEVEAPQFSKEATRALRGLDGPSHLAVRAVKAVSPSAQVRITVHKTLPVAGGMAGGSADAAAALVAANRFFGAGIQWEQLLEIGASLGADVPAALCGGISLGLGRGDKMELLRGGTSSPGSDSQWWVALCSREGLSTPRVFQEFDAKGGVADPRRGASIPGSSLDPDLRSSLLETPVGPASLVNELQAAAFLLRPELQETADFLKRRGAAPLLSGSGPTMLGAVASEQEARALAEQSSVLPWIRNAAVMWGPTQGAQLEPALPPWARQTQA